MKKFIILLSITIVLVSLISCKSSPNPIETTTNIEVFYSDLEKSSKELGYTMTVSDNQITLIKNDILIKLKVNSTYLEYSHKTRDIQPLDNVNNLPRAIILKDNIIYAPNEFISRLV